MIFIKGKWTYEVDKTKHIIKNSNIVTVDGEVIELNDSTLENIAMKLVNHAEIEENRKLAIKDHFIKKEGFENEITTLYGNFYFSFYNSIPNIGKQYLFRFIFLSTYLKYKDSRLMIKIDNKYKLIYENDLQQLLKLNKTEYYKTKKELINNNLIHINKDKTIHINNKISINGNIRANKKDHIRVFNNAIRDIYNKSTAKEHKQLYTLITLLPYINYNLNVLCFNPKETAPELIEPLRIEDITNILNSYKGNNKYKLQEILLNIFVDGEKAIMIIKDYKKEFFIINPRIYYKGNNIKDLKYLYNLFKI